MLRRIGQHFSGQAENTRGGYRTKIPRIEGLDEARKQKNFVQGNRATTIGREQPASSVSWPREGSRNDVTIHPHISVYRDALSACCDNGLDEGGKATGTRAAAKIAAGQGRTDRHRVRRTNEDQITYCGAASDRLDPPEPQRFARGYIYAKASHPGQPRHGDQGRQGPPDLQSQVASFSIVWLQNTPPFLNRSIGRQNRMRTDRLRWALSRRSGNPNALRMGITTD